MKTTSEEEYKGFLITSVREGEEARVITAENPDTGKTISMSELIGAGYGDEKSTIDYVKEMIDLLGKKI